MCIVARSTKGRMHVVLHIKVHIGQQQRELVIKSQKRVMIVMESSSFFPQLLNRCCVLHYSSFLDADLLSSERDNVIFVCLNEEKEIHIFCFSRFRLFLLRKFREISYFWG